MGQRGSRNAGLHVLHTNESDANNKYEKTVVTKSSFLNCFGQCVNAYKAGNIELNDNILFEARKYIVQVLDSKDITITNNLLIGALNPRTIDSHSKDEWDPVSIINMYTPYNPDTTNLIVNNNIG
mmetsp:Transcript_21109/g.2827  ORF Transcript_21109/g.2827 Transcript_21109/m.2827 type:complete len:125 (+) Transcript_21109:98-472(+)